MFNLFIYLFLFRFDSTPSLKLGSCFILVWDWNNEQYPVMVSISFLSPHRERESSLGHKSTLTAPQEKGVHENIVLCSDNSNTVLNLQTEIIFNDFRFHFYSEKLSFMSQNVLLVKDKVVFIRWRTSDLPSICSNCELFLSGPLEAPRRFM